MPTATFRFYEELNDFLPGQRRKRSFEYDCCQNATIKHAIEAIGVPHTEVEVILVNGESVGFSHPVCEGDRVSVYPVFESVNISPILRVRPEPLREPRFIADAHLGRLAGYLRMLGFDTAYENAIDDPALVDVAARQHRIVLTRDRDLLMHRAVTHGVYVRGRRPREQLEYLLDRLDLRAVLQPFTRCIRCNAILEDVPLSKVALQVPEDIAQRHRQFRRCTGCDQAYWPGSHYQRMRVFVERLVSGPSKI